MTDDEKRAAELAIIDDIPPPVSRATESRLVAADPALGEALGKLTCWGAAAGCNEAKPCPNCLAKRQYLTLLLHRQKHGKVVHPSDRAGYGSTDHELIPLPDNAAPEVIDAIELPEAIDIMDLMNAEDVAPPESLPLLGVDGYFIKRHTNLVAAFPKSGKTTVLYQAMADWLEMGETVLYFTEESKIKWKERQVTLGLVKKRGLQLVFGMGWAVPDLLKVLDASNASIVVIDTLEGLRILPEGDYHAGSMIAALEPWKLACRGRTFVPVHHETKAGGKDGRGVSGSYALVGAADVILELKRSSPENRRVISVVGRFGQPEDLKYEMDDDGLMRVVTDSDAADVWKQDVRKKKTDTELLGLIPSSPPGWVLGDLVREGRINTVTATAFLKRHVDTRQLVETGAGVRGNPHRYYRPSK